MAIRELFTKNSLPGNDVVTHEAFVAAAENGETEKLETLADQLAVAPSSDPDEPADEKESLSVEEVPFGFHPRLDPAGYSAGSGPINEALELDPHGSGVKGAAQTALGLDASTPDHSETETGHLAAAADVYPEATDDPSDPLPDGETLSA
ncbi:hypothetical protein EXE42_16850, partial [Halorubrum sp. SP3]